VRALDVVVAAPDLDDDLRLGEGIEDLTVEQLVAELGVEALTVLGSFRWPSRFQIRRPMLSSFSSKKGNGQLHLEEQAAPCRKDAPHCPVTYRKRPDG
jgi:hypothetical protein